MSWCQTYAGVASWPLDPDRNSVSDILVEDIAHSLAHQCRFNGHCTEFYSVAQHSVIVADQVYEATRNLEFARQGLMHDATETYLGDIPSPVKQLLPDFNILEEAWAKKIFARFEISYPMDVAIKIADRRLLMTEARQLMLWPPPQPWGNNIEPYNLHIDPLTPVLAKELFLQKMVFYKIINEQELIQIKQRTF